MVEILNTFVVHHHQLTFTNKLLIFFNFFSFLCTISRAVSTWFLLPRLFASCFILASKFIFLNLLNSCVVTIILCSFCIESSLGSQISDLSYFNLNSCCFCIQSSLCSQISDIRYFVFNLCGFCIESSSCNWTSNTRYLVIDLCNFCV